MQDCEENLEKEIEQKLEQTLEKEIGEKIEKKVSCNNTDVVYAMGIIGAAIFFISNATSFWLGVLGFLKALVWPVIIVYELLNFLMK